MAEQIVSDDEIFAWVREVLRDPEPVMEALSRLEVGEARDLAHRALSLLSGLVLMQEGAIYRLNEITDGNPDMPAEEMSLLLCQWLGGVPLGMGGLAWVMQEAAARISTTKSNPNDRPEGDTSWRAI